MTYLLSFRDDRLNVGGPVLGGHLQRRENGAMVTQGVGARAELALERRVVFLVHGYNVSRAEGIDQLQQLAALLPSNQDAGLVATIWPGDHWTGAISYPFEGRDADDTALEFARFIGDALTPGTPVCFVTHSLGARVALETMTHLLAETFPVEQVCLMAPAVDDFSLADADVYRPAVQSSARVGVLHSDGDRVLRWAYPLGDLLQAFIFFWREHTGLALGYGGPAEAGTDPGDVPPNVLGRALGDHGVDHGDYLPNDAGDGKPESAAAFADAVIAGHAQPEYPDP